MGILLELKALCVIIKDNEKYYTLYEIPLIIIDYSFIICTMTKITTTVIIYTNASHIIFQIAFHSFCLQNKL